VAQEDSQNVSDSQETMRTVFFNLAVASAYTYYLMLWEGKIVKKILDKNFGEKPYFLY
jgi:hypothetical protein